MRTYHDFCLTSALLLLFQLRATTAVRSLGQTVSLGNNTYFIPGTPEITVYTPWAFGLEETSLLPVTHVPENEAGSLQALFDDFADKDDVWTTSFADYVLLSGSHSPNFVSNCSSNTKFKHIGNASVLPELSALPPGPYFASVSSLRISIFKTYRFYADYAASFYYGVLQHSDGTFEVLSSASPHTDGGATIAVPSRLYFPAPSTEKPLSGVRTGVKDLYNLKGLKRSAGSRAWFHTYDAANQTAVSIQYLIDLGAVIVGRSRTSQFANGEAPTADWVDYHDPFNARGEGYQDPSSSSAGAGSAESNYDWIDLNIGSDTGGSVRAPAAVSGVFGNRPSQDLLNLTGVIPLSKYMDTAAFVARSAVDFASWGRAWYSAGNASLKDYSGFPQRLIYPIDTPGLNTSIVPSPGFFPVANPQAQALYESFTKGLESLLNTKREIYDFYTTYRNTSGTGLYPNEQLGAVWSLITSYEQAHGVFAQLTNDWGAAHHGDHPYFDPPVALNFQYGQNLTSTDYDQALTNKTIFKNWLETNVLIPQHDSTGCSSAVLIHPIWPGSPSYRDNYPTKSPEEAGIYFGWNQYGISQLGGVPEVVIPIGQVNYTSRITRTIKYLPVAVSINAAAGCDLMLYRLVEALAEEGVIPKTVKTGPSIR